MQKKTGNKIRWQLMPYDLIISVVSCWFIFLLYKGSTPLPFKGFLLQTLLFYCSNLIARIGFKVYNQVWRYGGIQSYIKLIISDAAGFVVYFVFERFLLTAYRVPFSHCLCVACLNLLMALTMRMLYRYAYKCGRQDNLLGKILRTMFFCATGQRLTAIESEKKIKLAIIGAGDIGINLAEELKANKTSVYDPICFVDINKEKIGREIHGLPVIGKEDNITETLNEHDIREVVFTIRSLEPEERRELYKYYKDAGFKVKVYDFPVMQSEENKKRHMREFDIEELLFRKPVDVIDDKTNAYYRDKVVLITGGGGSIGSELCRQIAKMGPKQLIILDIYENGAYDVQQELRLMYGEKLKVNVEIVSVTNKPGLERVFKEYEPQIVINAAAHKHVPLMEKNCIEAVENNVFGTLNTVELSEQYGAQRFMMVSTDKAVNPTNIMGATKRMCELIVLAHSTSGSNTKFSATRFGNVLGSAGSVIPLFRRQIASGGPITLTDKRIIRYFMTIPEASQLVLQSGAMANNGELFVLDMGQPVKILDLAESMIRLSGMEPGVDIEIIETGLRPGEKLYEELLVKDGDLDKTDNETIFIERDEPISMQELSEKLEILKRAALSESDDIVKEAMMMVVPTYRRPEEVNAEAEKSEEMQNVK